ncbi:hypothetical protein EPI10_011661 [Gossypium australe]|uniref:Uncharacterized protein n=1 Tax=Gossypium australe TaxID=47621 RepID=A0A5B6W7Y2_9ROSI|nr:hypothetical protein EPI10_011661 [Gossypium australe]
MEAVEKSSCEAIQGLKRGETIYLTEGVLTFAAVVEEDQWWTDPPYETMVEAKSLCMSPGGADGIRFGVLGGGNRRGRINSCKKLLANRVDRSTICAYIINSKSLRESYSHCHFRHAPRKTNSVAHLFSNRRIKERRNNLSDSRSAYRRTDGGRTPILDHTRGQEVKIEGDALTVVKSFLQIGWIDLPFVRI